MVNISRFSQSASKHRHMSGDQGYCHYHFFYSLSSGVEVKVEGILIILAIFYHIMDNFVFFQRLSTLVFVSADSVRRAIDSWVINGDRIATTGEGIGYFCRFLCLFGKNPTIITQMLHVVRNIQTGFV